MVVKWAEYLVKKDEDRRKKLAGVKLPEIRRESPPPQPVLPLSGLKLPAGFRQGVNRRPDLGLRLPGQGLPTQGVQPGQALGRSLFGRGQPTLPLTGLTLKKPPAFVSGYMNRDKAGMIFAPPPETELSVTPPPVTDLSAGRELGREISGQPTPDKVGLEYSPEKYLEYYLSQFQLGKEGKLPKKDWLDKARELEAKGPASVMPFLSSGQEAITLFGLLETSNALNNNEPVSPKALAELITYVTEAQRDTTFGYKVMDVLSFLLPFGGELYLTGGVFSAGKTAVTKSSLALLKQYSTKSGLKFLEGKLATLLVELAGTGAGASLQAFPAGATKIPASTIENQLTASLTGDEESVLLSFVKAVGQQLVEVLTERTGGAFGRASNAVKGQLIKRGLFSALLKANPKKAASSIRRLFQDMGYNGILAEFGEERLAEFGHGALAEIGLGNEYYKVPTLEQLMVELVAFSVPGVATRIAENAPAAMAEWQLNPERGSMRFGEPEVPENIPIDAVIKWKSEELKSLTNPLDITFGNQELKDLRQAKSQGRVYIPIEYFRNNRTGELEIPSDLQQPSPAVPPPQPPPAQIPGEPEVPITINNPGSALGGAGITGLTRDGVDYEYNGGWKIAGDFKQKIEPKIVNELDEFVDSKRKVLEDAIKERRAKGLSANIDITRAEGFQQPSIPTQIPGEPEAGYQPSMVEGVPEVEQLKKDRATLRALPKPTRAKPLSRKPATTPAPQPAQQVLHPATESVSGITPEQETAQLAEQVKAKLEAAPSSEIAQRPAVETSTRGGEPPSGVPPVSGETLSEIPPIPEDEFNGVRLSQPPEQQIRATSQLIGGAKGRILGIPGIQTVGKLINPVAVSNHPSTQLRAMAGMWDDQITGAIRLQTAPVLRIWRGVSALFNLDSQGRVLSSDIQQIMDLPGSVQNSNFLHDMIEFAPWYDFGKGVKGDKRRAFIEAVRNATNQATLMLREEGILVDGSPKPGQIQAKQGESGWVFLHRVVTEIKAEESIHLANRVNQLTSFVRIKGESDYTYLSRFAHAVANGEIAESPEINNLLERFGDIADVKVKRTTMGAKRSWETVAEGMKSGTTYEPDVLRELTKQINESYQLVKRKRFGDAVAMMIETTSPRAKALEDLGLTEEQAKAITDKFKMAKRLRGLLNRAVRGERVPLYQALETAFPEEVSKLKALIAKWQQQPIPETASEVKSLERDIERVTKKARTELAKITDLTKKYQERMGPYGTTEYGRVPGVPGLGSRVITPQWGKTGQQVADELRSYFGYMPSDLKTALEAVRAVGAVMRMFRLGFDLSTTLIQQAMGLGYDISNLAQGRPTATWAKATKTSVQTLVSKDMTHLEKFLEDNHDLVVDFIQRNGLVEGAEFTEGVDPVLGLIERIPDAANMKNIAKFIINHTLGRSDAVFTTARVSMGVNLYKAGYDIAEKEGRLDEWARAANNMSGVMSSKALGISSGQSAVEGAGIFLSPRFTRGNAGIIWKILSDPKSFTAKQYTKALAALFFTLTAIYLGVNRAQGKEVTLNPTDPSFGRIEIGNRTYSLGGIISDLRRLMAWVDATTYAISGKNISLSGKDDNTPGLLELGFQQFQTKTAPTTSTTIDVIRMYTDENARDWEGEPLTWTNILGNWSTPVWTDPILNHEKDMVGGILGEIIGLNTNDIMPWHYRYKWEKELADYFAIPSDSLEVKAGNLESRTKYREKNPDADARLFIVGQVTTIQTEAAMQKVKSLIMANNILPSDIRGVQQVLAEWEKEVELDIVDTRITLTEQLVMDIMKLERDNPGNVPTTSPSGFSSKRPYNPNGFSPQDTYNPDDFSSQRPYNPRGFTPK